MAIHPTVPRRRAGAALSAWTFPGVILLKSPGRIVARQRADRVAAITEYRPAVTTRNAARRTAS
jgi:hypothetical protein